MSKKQDITIKKNMTKDEWKDFILNNCINANGKWNGARLCEKWLSDRGVYEDIMGLYTDASCLHEVVYRILNNIDERPVCRACGNVINYSKQHGFPRFCSKKCVNSDPEVLEKNRKAVSKALTEKYSDPVQKEITNKKRAKTLTGDENGCSSPFGLKEVQKKIKETTMERYGVDNVFRLSEFHRTKEQMWEYASNIWKSRGIDITYDDEFAYVHNACPIHGTVKIPTKLLHINNLK